MILACQLTFNCGNAAFFTWQVDVKRVKLVHFPIIYSVAMPLQRHGGFEFELLFVRVQLEHVCGIAAAMS